MCAIDSDEVVHVFDFGDLVQVRNVFVLVRVRNVIPVFAEMVLQRDGDEKLFRTDCADVRVVRLRTAEEKYRL